MLRSGAESLEEPDRCDPRPSILRPGFGASSGQPDSDYWYVALTIPISFVCLKSTKCEIENHVRIAHGERRVADQKAEIERRVDEIERDLDVDIGTDFAFRHRAGDKGAAF